MKKIYASIVSALALCGTAYAGTDVLPIQTMTYDVANVETAVTTRGEVGPKEGATAAEVQGFYIMTGYSRAEGVGELKPGVNLYIDGTDAYLMGWWNMETLKGTYNPISGKLRIPAGQETFYTGDGGAKLQFYADKLTVENNKFTAETPMQYIEFEYFPKGVLNNKNEIMLIEGWYADVYDQMSLNVPSLRGSGRGYTWTYANKLQSVNQEFKMDKFNYNETDYKKLEDATLEDGWFKAYNGTGFGAYKVKCAIKGTEVVLIDPYGENSPYAQVDPDTNSPINYSAKTAHGYVVFDIANPKCVVVRPYVNSGFNIKSFYAFVSSEGATDRHYPTDGFFACTSYEGWKYYHDAWSIDDIIEEAELFGDPLPTYKDNVVTIPMARLQKPENKFPSPQFDQQSQWTASSGAAIPMETKITLPDLTGIGETLVSDENAPVKYFNLQGVEVANPAAGELVIVKQGNKVSKTIVK